MQTHLTPKCIFLFVAGRASTVSGVFPIQIETVEVPPSQELDDALVQLVPGLLGGYGFSKQISRMSPSSDGKQSLQLRIFLLQCIEARVP